MNGCSAYARHDSSRHRRRRESWGTALACVLAPRFESVRLWVNEPDLAARMQASRVNDVFLPDITIPSNVQVEHSLEQALASADVLLSVMPSHVVRDVYTRMVRSLSPRVRIVSASRDSKAERCCGCQR